MTEILSDPTVAAAGGTLLVAVVALWLAAAWWAYGDAARRSESSLAAFAAAAWIVLSTPLLLPLSLIIYTFARPQVTASDHRTKALVRELSATAAANAACPACGVGVDPAWHRCPTCATWLAAPCGSCGAWSDPAFEICPLCASDTHATPSVPDLEAPAAAGARGRGRAIWRAVGPGRASVRRPSRRSMSPLRVRA